MYNVTTKNRNLYDSTNCVNFICSASGVTLRSTLEILL